MKKLIFYISILFCLFQALPIYHAHSNSAPLKAKYEMAGSYKVHTLEFPDLVDTNRKNRPVPLKIFYPVQGKNFPLVIFSHGGGGNWDSYVNLIEHLVSHGYVVIAPQHKYSDNERIKFDRSRKGGRIRFLGSIYKMTKNPHAMLERPRDISFAINWAIKWNKNFGQLIGKINTNKIGVMGHSYGAYTTLTACGAQPILDYLQPPVNPGKGLAGDFSDKRITFGIALSPQPPGGSYFNKDSYKTIHCPIVGISGSRDKGLTFDDKTMSAENRWQFWKLLPEGNKYFLWLKNADHASFTHNPKSWMIPSRSRSDVQHIIKAMVVLFSDHFLKNKEGAKNYMNKDYVNTLSGSVVTDIQWLEK